MNYLILVNKDNKIKSNYLKNVELIDIINIDGKQIKIEKATYSAYLQLKNYLNERNIEIGIDSSYRSLEEQQKIYEEFITNYDEDYAKQIVAPVGISEHHTGLAIDISIKKNGKFLINNHDLMKEEKTFLEIHKSLAKFGFILRYPKEKEEITRYPYEAWHIRYVGVVPAKIIYENNWTLEEYLEKFSGILVVNKKKGCTSFDVVNEISHIFGIKRVGHTGTLDPLAEGVLVVTIGKACKIAELLTATYKEYEAGVLLGVKTDTLDITGKVIDNRPVYDDLDIEGVVKSYQKTYLQEVPIYSAVKVKGKKLYEYARNKEKIELPKKNVTIKEIELLSTDHDTFTFRAIVSKGCYIRSLINDIGESLNTFAIMTKLIRTKQGKFSLEDAYTIDDIKKNNYKLLSIDNALDYPVIEVEKNMAFKIKNGVKLKNTFAIEDKVIFKYQNNILGIYKKDKDMLKTWKNFNV